jgi:hypothetical protein
MTAIRNERVLANAAGLAGQAHLSVNVAVGEEQIEGEDDSEDTDAADNRALEPGAPAFTGPDPVAVVALMSVMRAFEASSDEQACS